MMKKITRIFAVFLSVMLLIPLFVSQPAFAACPLDEPDESVPFQYEVFGTNEGDIRALAKCKHCGDWFGYCGPGTLNESHLWYQADVSMPTCTSDGYYVIKCSRCDAEWTTTTDKAYGHSWSEWKETKAPACTSAGEETRECSECYEKESRSIPAKGHSWGSWKETKAATCAAEGQETRECSACHQKETRTVPMTGNHTWGSWKETKAATCAAEGEETRECSVCHKKETRSVPKNEDHKWGEWKPEKAELGELPQNEERECSVCRKKETRKLEIQDVLKKGDSGFEILIAKQLLALENEYTGEINRTFDDSLAQAIAAYQKASGREQDGLLSKETLQALAERFAGGFGNSVPPDGDLMQFDSGLNAEAGFEKSFASNGNGTHEMTARFTRVRFVLGEEEKIFDLPVSSVITLEAVHESCRVFNETQTCECGWENPFTFAFADFISLLQPGLSISSTTYDLPTDINGLYIIQELDYSEEDYLIYWDEVPDTAKYSLTLFVFDEEERDWREIVSDETQEAAYPISAADTGDYYVRVQAFNDASEPISELAEAVFTKLDGPKLAPPKNLSFSWGLATWTNINTTVNTGFTARLYARNSFKGDDELIAEIETAACEADFTLEIAKRIGFPPGTELFVGVFANDLDHNKGYSDPVYTDPQPYRVPAYYRAATSVNVRSGPGKEYSRVGGLSKGDIVASYETEKGSDGATYLIIAYKGELRYVNAAFMEWFTPKEFTVKVNLGNDITIEVKTNVDSTIDMNDFESKIARPENGRVGYVMTGFGGGIDEFTPLSPGQNLSTNWSKDPRYVFVNFFVEGKLKETVPILIGNTYPGLQVDKSSAKVWTTGSDGSGELVTPSTRFTSSMENIYLTKFMGRDVTLGEYANSCPGFFRNLYASNTIQSDIHGSLIAGDRLRLISVWNAPDSAVELGSGKTRVSNNYYEVYSYRLDKRGWILAELLDGASNAKRYVYFDANGGSCSVKRMSVSASTGEISRNQYAPLTYENEYHILNYPTPSRDGYVFTGWQDEKGNFYYPETQIDRPRIDLKAVWENGKPYSTWTGVVYNPGSVVAYFEGPDGMYSGEYPHAHTVQILDETADMYYCKLLDFAFQKGWFYKEYVLPYEEIRYTTMFAWPNATAKKEKDKLGMVTADYPVYVLEKASGRSHIVFDTGAFEWGANGECWIDTPKSHAYSSSEVYMTFDAGWGTCPVFHQRMIYHQYYNTSKPSGYTMDQEFPAASCPGYEFIGWYTDPISGVRVDSRMTFEGNVTVFAHYRQIYDGRIWVVNAPARLYKNYSSGVTYYGKEIPTGTVLIAERTKSDGSEIYTTWGGVSGWIATSRLYEGTLMTTTHVEYKTDRYVRRAASTSYSLKYYEVRAGETFVVVGEVNSYYKVAYPQGEFGYAYVKKAHFM
ncbi:MAG: InlB B-repeat-containing protein [Clostridia bacterium]|nr:InlB B-repeat-containing protein [Clostridia bacterium]